MRYRGYDMSPRKPQTLSDTPSDACPDAPSHTRSGKTMTMQNDSKAPFKVNAKVSLTLKFGAGTERRTGQKERLSIARTRPGRLSHGNFLQQAYRQ